MIPITVARRGVASVAAGVLTAVVLASCSSSVLTTGGTAANESGSGTAPLATSLSAAGGTWATVAMGHLDDPANTFWQLFFRAAGAASWTNKVEATAVATNGGIVMASPAGKSVIVGVRPYDFLTFSPLIATADGGRSWSNGLLPGGLVATPNALAASPSGTALAVTSTGSSPASESVLTSSSNSLSSWQTLASHATLATTPAGQQCGLGDLGAAGFDGPDPVVGAGCTHPGVVGLFGLSGAAWKLVGPTLPPSMNQDLVSVLSLQSTGPGLACLLDLSGPAGTSVMSAWTGGPGQPWQLSGPLPLGSSERVTSVGEAGGDGFFVLLSSSSDPERAAEMAARQSAWKVLPPPPAGTATLVFGPGTTVEALAVNSATLTVWTLGASGTWHEGQVMTVSIEYGSSS